MKRTWLALALAATLVAAPAHAMTAQQACRASGGLDVASCGQWIIEEVFAALGGW